MAMQPYFSEQPIEMIASKLSASSTPVVDELCCWAKPTMAARAAT